MYVLYETGNDIFFSHIADIFCRGMVNFIREKYVAGVFIRPGEKLGLENAEKVVEFFRENGKVLTALHCDRIPGIPNPCRINGCRPSYRAVLASDQVEMARECMERAIRELYTRGGLRGWDKYNYQRIFQCYNSIKKCAMDEIPIASESDPIDYKSRNPAAYMRSYIDGTNKMKEKAEQFVYVCAATDSDYADFMAKTELPGVISCDALQAV